MVTEYLRRAALGVAHDVSIPELPIPRASTLEPSLMSPPEKSASRGGR